MSGAITLGYFYSQNREVTIAACLFDGFVPDCILTPRPIRTSPKGLAGLGAARNQTTRATLFRAFYFGLRTLNCWAGRIIHTGDVFAISSALHNHIFAAFRAFVAGELRHFDLQDAFFIAYEFSGIPALRVVGASEKLTT